MGKYMRKSKNSSEMALMEVSKAQSSIGVRTRAKTLALKRLQNSNAAGAAAVAAVEAAADGGGNGGSYLQLRSRRLEKPPTMVQESRRQKHSAKQREASKLSNPNPRSGSRNSGSKAGSRSRVRSTADSVPVKQPVEEKKVAAKEEKNVELLNAVDKEEKAVSDDSGSKDEVKEAAKSNSGGGGYGDGGADDGLEASFGENVLEIESRDRETTPCNLIRDPETIRTPGSSTRPTTNRVQNPPRRQIPTTGEMDEYFRRAEEAQRQQFIEKYNFDPVKEKPLPGRFEWEKVKP